MHHRLTSVIRTFFVPLPLHPLCLFATALVLGIIWQSHHGPWSAIIMGALVFTSTTLVSRSIPSKNQLILLLAISGLFFCAGALRVQQRVEIFYSFHRATNHKKITFSGTVTDSEPNLKEGEEQTTLTVVICKAHDENNVELNGTSRQRIIISVRGKIDITPGDTILCTSVWFRRPLNEYFHRYLIKEDVTSYLFLKPTAIRVVNHPSWSINRFISQQRNRVVATMQQTLSPRTFALFASTFWGKKTLNNDEMTEIREHFKPWGTLHQLARSGLHLMILVVIFSRLMAFIPAPFTIRVILLIFIIFLYLLFSWNSISFIRATLVFFLYKLCDLVNLQTHGLYLLTFAFCLILLYNPIQLFFLDFQLSFSLTFILSWLNILKKIKPLQFGKT